MRKRILATIVRNQWPMWIGCALIGALGYVGHGKLWWAILAALAGPVVMAPIGWLTAKSEIEFRDMLDSIRRRGNGGGDGAL